MREQENRFEKIKHETKLIPKVRDKNKTTFMRRKVMQQGQNIIIHAVKQCGPNYWKPIETKVQRMKQLFKGERI